MNISRLRDWLLGEIDRLMSILIENEHQLTKRDHKELYIVTNHLRRINNIVLRK